MAGLIRWQKHGELDGRNELPNIVNETDDAKLLRLRGNCQLLCIHVSCEGKKTWHRGGMVLANLTRFVLG